MRFSQAARKIWGHPLFATGVVVLLINDFLLKEAFHNGLTGKLSDIAGMAVFPAFFCVFRIQSSRLIYLLSALFFVWWKLPFSDPGIAALNGSGIPVARVIDPTDLWALLVLPLSWYFIIRSERRHALSPFTAYAAGFIGLIAFCATSLPRPRNGIRRYTGWPAYESFYTRHEPARVLALMDSLGFRPEQDSITYVLVDLPGVYTEEMWPDGSIAYNQSLMEGALVKGSAERVFAHKGEALRIPDSQQLYFRSVNRQQYRIYNVPADKSGTRLVPALQTRLHPEGSGTRVSISAIWLAEDQIRLPEGKQRRAIKRSARKTSRRLSRMLFESTKGR
jgi:hypothetical protein